MWISCDCECDSRSATATKSPIVGIRGNRICLRMLIRSEKEAITGNVSWNYVRKRLRCFCPETFVLLGRIRQQRDDFSLLQLIRRNNVKAATHDLANLTSMLNQLTCLSKLDSLDGMVRFDQVLDLANRLRHDKIWFMSQRQALTWRGNARVSLSSALDIAI